MRFEVRVLSADGAVQLLALDAPNRDDALEQARAQGLVALSARSRRSVIASWRPLNTRFALLQFSQELVSLLRAGLPLTETIATMVEKDTRADVHRVLAALQSALREGRSFSQALEALPAAFDALFVATVRAAERTGDLVEALARYIEYQQQIDSVRKKIVSASVYPAVLLAVGAAVTLFLLAYVVPRFSLIYAESGRELPFMSRLLMEWGQLMNAHGLLLLSVAAASMVLGGLFLTRLLALLRRLVMRIPAIGSRVLVYHLARFYRTVGMLLRGGTPVVRALAMVSGLLPAHLHARLAVASQRIREGASLSDAMTAAQLTTPVASRMLRVGERSGDMAAMMERIAAFHDEELARWVDWFTKLFEPVLMALLGVAIGGIVVLMYLPIFELAGSLQ